MRLKVNRVFGSESLGRQASGPRAWGANPSLAGPRNGRLRGRQKALVPGRAKLSPQGQGRGGALRGADASWLSVLRAPRAPQLRSGKATSPQAPASAVPGDRKRPVARPLGSRSGLRPGDLELSLTGIGELALQAPAGWAAYPIPGLERRCAPLPQPGVREQGAGSRAVGAGAGGGCVRWAGRRRSSLPSSFPSPDGAPPL